MLFMSLSRLSGLCQKKLEKLIAISTLIAAENWVLNRRGTAQTDALDEELKSSGKMKASRQRKPLN